MWTKRNCIFIIQWHFNCLKKQIYIRGLFLFRHWNWYQRPVINSFIIMYANLLFAIFVACESSSGSVVIILWCGVMCFIFVLLLLVDKLFVSQNLTRTDLWPLRDIKSFIVNSNTLTSADAGPFRAHWNGYYLWTADTCHIESHKIQIKIQLCQLLC